MGNGYMQTLRASIALQRQVSRSKTAGSADTCERDGIALQPELCLESEVACVVTD